MSLGTKFHFKQTVLNFWIKLIQKGYFRREQKKRTSPLNSEIILSTKFQLKLTTLIF